MSNKEKELRLTGTVERIVQHDKRTDFAILRIAIKPSSGMDLPEPIEQMHSITATGIFHNPEVGEQFRIVGLAHKHHQYGWQVRAKRAIKANLLNRASAEIVLRSGMFGRLTFDEIKRLRKIVPDLGQVLEDGQLQAGEYQGGDYHLVKKALSNWEPCQRLRTGAGFLRSLGLGFEAMNRTLAVYGVRTIDIVSSSPYRLLGIPGIGFKSVDQLALNLGFAEVSDMRLAKSLDHLIDKSRGQGNTVIPPNVLIESACDLVKSSQPNMARSLHKGVTKGRFRSTQGFVGSTELVGCEYELAERIVQMQTPAKKLPEHESCKTLYKNQLSAVQSLLGVNFGVLTGGPGVGKTTVLKALANSLKPTGEVVLLAPTGKAACRLAESTGMPAQTLHQVLQYKGKNGFTRNAKCPLEGGAFIVDEASMVDVYLMTQLVRALPPGARLYLVGDKDQIASVDAGNLLGDIIESGVSTVAELHGSRRTRDGSDINIAATAFNQGVIPTNLEGTGEFEFIDTDCSDEDMASMIEHLISDSLPKQGFSKEQIQILTPQRTSPVGVQALNKQLQSKLNPSAPGDGLRLFGQTFLPGDPVMQVVNDYERELANGQTGRVVHMDTKEQKLWVRFENNLHQMCAEQIAEIRLAYASTIHKSQGSEFDVVILPVTKSHSNMLSKPLVYTGTTRGKQKVIVIGSRKVLEASLKREPDAKRQTLLSHLLKTMTAEKTHEANHEPSAMTM